jgi:hypothetical protein
VKHTTREWRIDNRTFDEGARGTVIAEVLTTFGGITIRAEPTDDKLPSCAVIDAEGEANANLISAAPELLAIAVAYVKLCEDRFYDIDEMNSESKSLYYDAKAAIKKARGL